jgi:hypothetical protein
MNEDATITQGIVTKLVRNAVIVQLDNRYMIRATLSGGCDCEHAPVPFLIFVKEI